MHHDYTLILLEFRNRILRIPTTTGLKFEYAMGEYQVFWRIISVGYDIMPICIPLVILQTGDTVSRKHCH